MNNISLIGLLQYKAEVQNITDQQVDSINTARLMYTGRFYEAVFVNSTEYLSAYTSSRAAPLEELQGLDP